MEPSHVLVPLDGSQLAYSALSHALAVFDCQITVLNVITPIDTSMSEGGVLEADDQRKAEAKQRADRLVSRAQDQISDAAQPTATVVKTGDPGETILEFVENTDIDHIVMGGHGGEQRPLTQRLLGTVVTKVVTEAPVTVTVVR